MSETVKDVAKRSKDLAHRAKALKPPPLEGPVNIEALQTAAEGTTLLVSTSLQTAATRASTYGLRTLEMASANVAAAVDLVSELMTATSPARVIEISGEHAGAHLERLACQCEALWTLTDPHGEKPT